MSSQKDALFALKSKISRYRAGMKAWQERLSVTRQTFYGYFRTQRKTNRLEKVLEIGASVLKELEATI
jgi:hypothetical protein